jgi:hypothetical protein
VVQGKYKRIKMNGACQLLVSADDTHLLSKNMNIVTKENRCFVTHKDVSTEINIEKNYVSVHLDIKI